MNKYLFDIEVKPRKVSWFYYFMKRTWDIFFSILLLLLTSLIILVVLIILACSGNGTPIYADKRVGKNGKTIKVLKFRSMYKDADDNPRKYLNDEQYEQFIKERKVDNDPRITKFGKIIRKTSIDELPQLFNILGGSMSVVGNRPITTQELEANYKEEQQKVFVSARPGLTGWWQVSGRNNVEYYNGERQKLELEYYEKRSIGFDIKIMFKTIPAVLKHKGVK
ncbi:MAG: sugar transferase [Bacilli bacterium]|nr:sugar transferase [Bacilli bacterium]